MESGWHNISREDSMPLNSNQTEQSNLQSGAGFDLAILWLQDWCPTNKATVVQNLFVDVEKKCYKDLNYKRFGRLSLVPALFAKSSRDAHAESKVSNLGGDLKGDYYQVGGTMVVSKGGEEVLLNHKQQELADHVNPAEVLKCLNIPVEQLQENQ